MSQGSSNVSESVINFNLRITFLFSTEPENWRWYGQWSYCINENVLLQEVIL